MAEERCTCTPNEHEEARNLRIAENQRVLASLGILRYATLAFVTWYVANPNARRHSASPIQSLEVTSDVQSPPMSSQSDMWARTHDLILHGTHKGLGFA